MAAAVAASGAELCLMHMLGEPRTMQDDPRYGDVEGDVELEPLTDLLLGVAEAVMRVDGEAAQFDLDTRFDFVVARLVHGVNLSEERGQPAIAAAI